MLYVLLPSSIEIHARLSHLPSISVSISKLSLYRYIQIIGHCYRARGMYSAWNLFRLRLLLSALCARYITAGQQTLLIKQRRQLHWCSVVYIYKHFCAKNWALFNLNFSSYALFYKALSLSSLSFRPDELQQWCAPLLFRRPLRAPALLLLLVLLARAHFLLLLYYAARAIYYHCSYYSCFFLAQTFAALLTASCTFYPPTPSFFFIFPLGFRELVMN